VRRNVGTEHTTLLPADAVQATVHDHVVTLTGMVAWQHQRTAAVYAVGAFGRLTDVRNRIELQSVETVIASADAEVNVAAALLRNAQLEAQHVEVAVSGTEIRLTGHVTTWAACHRPSTRHESCLSCPGVYRCSTSTSLMDSLESRGIGASGRCKIPVIS